MVSDHVNGHYSFVIKTISQGSVTSQKSMNDIYHSIKDHSQKEDIMEQIKYGQSKQRLIRPLFKMFLDIFDTAEISYSMGFGTLLGCVRHGFEIPWDDDYDIHILKQDIHKLLDLKLEKISRKHEAFSGYMSRHPNKKILVAYTISPSKGNEGYYIFFVQTPWNFIQLFTINIKNRKTLKVTDIFHEEWKGIIWVDEETMFPLITKPMSGLTVSIMNNWEAYLNRRYSDDWDKNCVVSNHALETSFNNKSGTHLSFQLVREPRWKKWLRWLRRK